VDRKHGHPLCFNFPHAQNVCAYIHSFHTTLIIFLKYRSVGAQDDDYNSPRSNMPGPLGPPIPWNVYCHGCMGWHRQGLRRYRDQSILTQDHILFQYVQVLVENAYFMTLICSSDGLRLRHLMFHFSGFNLEALSPHWPLEVAFPRRSRLFFGFFLDQLNPRCMYFCLAIC